MPLSDKIIHSENFIAKQFQIGEFIVINRNKYRSVLRQQLMQQFQPGIHHAEPLVVAAQILALLAHDLAQLLLDFRVVHVVVVNPLFVARVVRRIDIDALHATFSGSSDFSASKLSPCMILLSLSVGVRSPSSSARNPYLCSSTRYGTS